ncbi:MAG: DNA-methyltransferase, partial [Candidatus Thorarchaeota archaeon]
IGKEYETKRSLSEYAEEQKKVITECIRVLKKGGSLCWQVGHYVIESEVLPLDIFFYNIIKSIGDDHPDFELKLRNRIVWHFGHGLHASNRFSGRHETILWFTRGNNYIFNLDPVRVPQKYPGKKAYKGPRKGKISGHPLGKNPSDVWDIPNVKSNHIEKTIHPCQYPVALIERLILALTNEGDVVLDPFAGVGTTNVAAILNRRKSIGMEVVQDYIEIARQRIRDASIGILKTRPLDKPVYKPPNSSQRVQDILDEDSQ